MWDLKFDAIRILSNGEYRVAQSQALEHAGEKKNWLTRLPDHAPELYKKLVRKGFDQVTLPVKYTKIGKNKRKIIVTAESLSLSCVSILWLFLNKEYNKPQTERLVEALVFDSLRDRFDEVYSLQRQSETRKYFDKRILDKADPWEKLFDKQMCVRVAQWFKSSDFYWDFF